MTNRPFSPKAYVADKIGYENLDKFHRWAFGNTFDASMMMKDLKTLWLEQHGKTKGICFDDPIRKTLDKMVKMWNGSK